MNQNTSKFLAIVTTVIIALAPFHASNAKEKEYKVKITEDLSYVEVQQGGKMVRIERNQDTESRLSNSFTKTSRVCPPFCVSPIKIGENITTVGELELLEFLNTKVRDKKGLLVDARMQDWFTRGTIPGSANIPFTVLSMGIENEHIQKILTVLGAKNNNGEWDFSEALDLMIFCNGPWCQQSPKALKNLSKLGYPEKKLFWYRSGMQSWQQLGLTVSTP
ncbi:MAG: rhodanese-like domain-containing protein [Thiotrichaceae bacterium]|nr:rhodanese-like domain-containing protein [Thiotrichaceae bacterium]